MQGIEAITEDYINKLTGLSIEELPKLSATAIHSILSMLPSAISIMLLERVCDLMESDKHLAVHGYPDALHNLAMTAARHSRDDLQRRFVEVGVKAHPDSVDLLADLLQLRIQHYNDKKLANETLQALKATTDSDRYWRYWVFSALYYTEFENDTQKAFETLIQGIDHVPCGEVYNIYRNIYDAANKTNNPETIKQAIRLLKQGLNKGYNNSYTIAHELAIAALDGGDGFVEAEPSDDDCLAQLSKNYLKQLEASLAYLDTAEHLFTANRQHSIEDIYRTRVNVLMALSRYEEAITHIKAIYANKNKEEIDRYNSQDGSLQHQLVKACQKTKKPDEWKDILNPKDPEN